MGFPDNYTLLDKSTDTARFKAIGNSWAIPVVQWIAKQIQQYKELNKSIDWIENVLPYEETDLYRLYLFPKGTSKNTLHKPHNLHIPNNLQ